MELSADGKFLFVLADGKPMKVDDRSGKAEPVKTGGEMVLNEARRARLHLRPRLAAVQREVLRSPTCKGVDWDFYYRDYRKFLPYINNNYDFAEMLSEMLGEVNASHTGCHYRPDEPNTDQTAELGLLYDLGFAGPGVKVAEVVEGGPLDKAASKVRAGHIIEKIDGTTAEPSTGLLPAAEPQGRAS